MAAIQFNPLLPEFIVDPYPFYARLRTEDPVHRSPLGIWVLSRYADALLLLRNPRFGRANYDRLILERFGDGPLYSSFRRWMLFADPPDHTRLRGLVSKAITPRAVEALRPKIERLVDELLAPLIAGGRMDLIAEVAQPLPVLVIGELLGVGATEVAQFWRWSDALALALEIATATPEIAAEADEAARGLTEYFREVIDRRRGHPTDDLISALIAAEEQGSQLDQDELIATCVMLFFAGHETTVNLIGNGLLALLRQPDQLGRLRENPALMPTAVEELVRYDSSVQRTARTANDDLELDGKMIRRGEHVVALIGAANRDPDRFSEPDRLDLGRQDNPHLSFGGGIHYCIGAPLARVEASTALSALLTRLPNLALDPTAPPVWRQRSNMRGLQSLPISW
jgi:pimeloyl-[acyl-carrier protein] synthase